MWVGGRIVGRGKRLVGKLDDRQKKLCDEGFVVRGRLELFIQRTLRDLLKKKLLSMKCRTYSCKESNPGTLKMRLQPSTYPLALNSYFHRFLQNRFLNKLRLWTQQSLASQPSKHLFQFVSTEIAMTTETESAKTLKNFSNHTRLPLLELSLRLFLCCGRKQNCTFRGVDGMVDETAHTFPADTHFRLTFDGSEIVLRWFRDKNSSIVGFLVDEDSNGLVHPFHTLSHVEFCCLAKVDGNNGHKI